MRKNVRRWRVSEVMFSSSLFAHASYFAIFSSLIGSSRSLGSASRSGKLPRWSLLSLTALASPRVLRVPNACGRLNDRNAKRRRRMAPQERDLDLVCDARCGRLLEVQEEIEEREPPLLVPSVLRYA